MKINLQELRLPRAQAKRILGPLVDQLVKLTAEHRESGGLMQFATAALAYHLIFNRRDAHPRLPRSLQLTGLIRSDLFHGSNPSDELAALFHKANDYASHDWRDLKIGAFLESVQLESYSSPHARGVMDILETIVSLPAPASAIEAGQVFRAFLRMSGFGESQNTEAMVTPEPVNDVVLAIALACWQQSSITAYDPTVGFGTWLSELALLTGNRNGEGLHGQDISQTAVDVARLNLVVSGLHQAQISRGHAMFESMATMGSRLEFYDLVLGDIPYGQRNWGYESNRVEFLLPYGVPPRSRGDWAFVGIMWLSAHRDHGRVVCAMHPAALFRSGVDEQIRQGYLNDHHIESVTLLPSGLSAYTSTPTAILTLSRKRDRPNVKYVLFIDASELVIGKRAPRKLTPDAVERIAAKIKAFRQGASPEQLFEPGFSTAASIDRIAKNEYALLPTRYLSVEQTSEPIDVEETFAEYQAVQTRLAKLQVEAVAALHRLNA